MLLIAATISAAAYAEITFDPSWAIPDYDIVRSQVQDWRNNSRLDPAVDEKIDKLWPKESPGDPEAARLLDRVADSFAIVYPEATDMVAACRAKYSNPSLPKIGWLAEPRAPKFVRDNLRLYYARWLADFSLYDEVLAAIDGLQPAEVVDPASLLFYRMVAHHQLVHPDEARAALTELLEREDELPRRYQQVAELVQRDLTTLEDESLDHIARRMSDIRRRLDYGRAGSHVQQVEQGVVDSLDKKIDQLEKQQQQQCQKPQAGGSQKASKPMDDSRIAEMKAPGRVDQRDIGHQSGWGDLPPKEREQALQQIGRDYPAYYRELIEQYFRDLANQETPPPK